MDFEKVNNFQNEVKSTDKVTIIVLKEFIDKFTGEYRHIGTKYEVDKDRAKELAKLKYVKIV